MLERFAALPQIVALIEQASGARSASPSRACPSSSSPPRPQRLGTALLRATGSPAYVAALEPLPDAPDEHAVYAALGVPWCPPELREAPFRGEPPPLVGLARHPRRPALPHDLVRRPRERRGDGPRRPRPRLRVPRDLRPHAGGRRRARAQPDDVRRQGEEIAAANEALAPFRVLRGIECDILPDGRLDLPDDVLAELDWVQASVHGGQRMPRREMTARVEAALRNPTCPASATRRAGSSAAGRRTRSTSSASTRWRSSTASRSRSTACPPGSTSAASTFDFTNGFHDTANAMATTIATGRAARPTWRLRSRRS